LTTEQPANSIARSCGPR